VKAGGDTFWGKQERKAKGNGERFVRFGGRLYGLVDEVVGAERIKERRERARKNLKRTVHGEGVRGQKARKSV